MTDRTAAEVRASIRQAKRYARAVATAERDDLEERDRLKAVNADLLAVLECVANNRLSKDMPDDERADHDYAQGWDALVLTARAAIARAKGNEHES